MLLTTLWQSYSILVRSKHRDIVYQLRKCGSRGLDLIFPVLYLRNIFTAVRARTSTSRGFFFFMHHPGKRSLAMCGHTVGALRDFIVVIHRDILP